MSISIFTILLLTYILLKIKRNSQLRMDTLQNLTIKLGLEEDENAHYEKCQKNEANKIKTINDLENKRDIVFKQKIKLNKTYLICIYNLKTCSLKIFKSSIFLIEWVKYCVMLHP